MAEKSDEKKELNTPIRAENIEKALDHLTRYYELLLRYGNMSPTEDWVDENGIEILPPTGIKFDTPATREYDRLERLGQECQEFFRRHRKELLDERLIREDVYPEDIVWSPKAESSVRSAPEDQVRKILCEKTESIIAALKTLRVKQGEGNDTETPASEAGAKATATKPAEEKAQASGIEQAATLSLIKTNKGNVKASVLKKGAKTSPLYRLPTIAISELIRATGDGLQDPNWIKERVCQREGKWKKMVDEGKDPDLSHEEKEIKKAIKTVFGAAYTPWNPLPFKIEIKDL